MEEVANRDGRDFGGGISSRGYFATPADFPRRDCSPYRGLHVHRESLGFVHRSRSITVAPCQTRAACRLAGCSATRLTPGGSAFFLFLRQAEPTAKRAKTEEGGGLLGGLIGGYGSDDGEEPHVGDDSDGGSEEFDPYA